MKVRIVWCMHTVALLFGVSILAVWVISYYCGAIRTATSGTTGIRTTLFIGQGSVGIRKQYGVTWVDPTQYHFKSKVDPIEWAEDFASVCAVRKHFPLNIHYQASVNEDGETLFSFTVMPLWIYLSLPITWLCSFLLFRRLRRSRPKRCDSPTH